MNLNKELNKLQDLSIVLQSTISKTRAEVSKYKNTESKQILSFMDEMEECIKNGKGIEDLQNKMKDYADNK